MDCLEAVLCRDFLREALGGVKDLSLIIPLNNEEEGLDLFYHRLTGALSQIKKTYEIVFIDDGSTDQTYNKLLKIYEEDVSCIIVRLDKNYGQSMALWVGMRYARGSVIVNMDGDSQHDPWDIPKLLGKIDAGYDMAVGCRAWETGSLLIGRLPTWLGNKFVSFLLKENLRDPSSSYRAFRRGIVEGMKPYWGWHRFLPLIVNRGISIGEIETQCVARTRGYSHYGLNKAVIVVYQFLMLIFFKEYAWDRRVYSIVAVNTH